MPRPSDDDFATDSRELVAASGPAPGTGLITKPRDRGLAPALMAEQQRAKSEIEAALTIAAARPRDQVAAMDRILTSCQRPGLANNSQYQYARGGTDISGPNIRLMEVIAQNWGNIEWGFRELARFPGTSGQPGESVVEAVAWDLETNSRVRKQFTVSHSERTKKGLKTFTDPRDIYEWVANQAQRRVRTALENIIPRDVQEAACEECDKTLKASIADISKATADMLKAFAALGVEKEMIEARIQRRIDSITAGQIIGLRKIYASIKDGLSDSGDWFSAAEAQEPQKSAADQAKDAMRKRSAANASAVPQANAAEQSEQPVADDESMTVAQWIDAASQNESVKELQDSLANIPSVPGLSADSQAKIRNRIEMRIAELRPRGRTQKTLS